MSPRQRANSGDFLEAGGEESAKGVLAGDRPASAACLSAASSRPASAADPGDAAARTGTGCGRPGTLYPCQPVFLDGVIVGVAGACGPQPVDWRRMLCIIATTYLAVFSMGRSAGALGGACAAIHLSQDE